MAITPEGYVERLTGAAAKKYTLLGEILELTRSQSQVITEDGIDSLEKLVAEKQAKIDGINKIDEEFNVYFQRLKQELRIKSLDELKNSGIRGLKELQVLVGRIMSIMEEIAGIEAVNNAKVKSVLDSLGDEIKKINQGKRLNTAYNPRPIQTGSYFIDKKK